MLQPPPPPPLPRPPAAAVAILPHVVWAPARPHLQTHLAHPLPVELACAPQDARVVFGSDQVVTCVEVAGAVPCRGAEAAGNRRTGRRNVSDCGAGSGAPGRARGEARATLYRRHPPTSPPPRRRTLTHLLSSVDTAANADDTTCQSENSGRAAISVSFALSWLPFSTAMDSQSAVCGLTSAPVTTVPLKPGWWWRWVRRSSAIWVYRSKGTQGGTGTGGGGGVRVCGGRGRKTGGANGQGE